MAPHLRPPTSSSQPLRIGETFRLSNGGVEAVCELWSCPPEWEVRLNIGGDPVRTARCRSRREVLSTSEAWHTALNADGWR